MINFTSGLIRTPDGIYIKPENITSIYDTQGILKNKMTRIETVRPENSIDIYNVQAADKVADAVIKAEKTGEIIDVNA